MRVKEADMDTTQLNLKQQTDYKHTRLPVEHDRDWEYTGKFFMCLQCGHEFRRPPYNLEVCPECGTDFWTDGE
jgi:rubrerythrin